MGDLTELLGVNSRQTLMFFFGYLEKEAKMDKVETLYVATILAHYAQVSRSDECFMPPVASLYEVLNTFVLSGLTTEGSAGLQDPEILEIAGSQTLLLVGFFRDQLKKTRHNLSWYDSVGSSFFARASCRTKAAKKARLLESVATHFPQWATSCRNISRTMREERYLLKLN